MKLHKLIGGIAVVAGLAFSAPAQSLGEQARENRANKPEAPQTKVYTNDNLPTGGAISVLGTPVPPASASAASTPDGKSAKSANAAAPVAASAEDKQKETDKLKADVQAQKDEISRLERELDISTREWKLRQAAYYADAGNQLRDPAAWAAQERKYNDETTQKKQALDNAKQKLDDMQEQARKSGLSSSAVE